jgi:hypothetical protein
MSGKIFSEGTYVTNPRMPDWGMGKILELRDGGNARVFFETAGERIMAPANLTLETAHGDYPLLNNISNVTKISKVKATQAKPKKVV